MSVFIDTSAFIATMDADDLLHPKCTPVWEEILNDEDIILTSNYVVVETIALLQRRFGLPAVRSFEVDMLSPVIIEWVSEADHRSAISAVLSAGKRKVSLVDYVSFEIMRRLKINRVFSCDKHFRTQGFTILP